MMPEKAGALKQNKMFRINTNDMCLICFKECDPEFGKDGKLLSKTLSRYFGVDFQVQELVLELQRMGTPLVTTPFLVTFPICQNCSMLADKISKLFQQLEVLQMKLHAYGQNLSDIMSSAEKVSTRVSLFRKRLASVEESSPRMARKIVEKVRREMIAKCSRPKHVKLTKQMLPPVQVVLKKEIFPEEDYHLPLSATTSCCCCQLPLTDFPITEENWLAFVGCTVSLWIVFLLSLMDVDLLVETALLRRNSCELEALKTSLKNSFALEHTIKSIHSQTDFDEIVLTDKPLRKRKTSGDNDIAAKKAQFDDDKPLPVIMVTLAEQDGKDVTDSDVNREEHSTAFLQIARKVLRKRKSYLKPELVSREQKEIPQQEMHLYSLITKEQAIAAVNAIQIPPGFPKGSKIEMVKQEAVVDEDPMDFFPTNDMLCSSFVDQREVKIQNPIATARECPDMKHPSLEEVHSAHPITTALNFFSLPNKQESPFSPVNPFLILNVTKGKSSPDSGYTCDLCQQNFDCRGMLEKHRAVIHKLQKYVRCPTCSKMLFDYYHLELHRKSAQECNINDDEKEHEMSDIARPLFPFDSSIRGMNFCPVEDCCEVFDNGRKLSVHLKLHGSFQCRFGCLKTFKKGHELAMHEVENHGYGGAQDLLKCPRCEYKTSKKEVNEYILHFIRSHLNISPYVGECRICNKSFCSLSGSRAHFSNYHNVLGRSAKSIFKCDQCNGLFRKKGQLLQHQQMMHVVPI